MNKHFNRIFIPLTFALLIVGFSAADVNGVLAKTKTDPTLSVTNSPVTYNGSQQSATVIGSVAGLVANVKYNGSATVPTAAGTYAITADFNPTDNANYNNLNNASAGNFIIQKATPTLSITNSPATYTGSAHTPVVTGSVSGSVSNILIDGIGSKTTAGTWAVTASFVPTDTANYNSLTNVSAGNFIINKAGSTTTITCPVSVDYTGSALTPCTVLVTRVGSADLTPDPTYANNILGGTATASYSYAGDTNHNGSSDSKTFLIIQDTTPPTVAGVDSDGKTFNSISASPQTIKITFSEDVANEPSVEVHTVSQSQVVNNCSDADAKTFCFNYTIFPDQDSTTHTIYISGATDSFGNTMTQDSSHTFIIDTKSPVLNLPVTIMAEANNPGGASVLFSATATDANPAGPEVSCTPNSGSIFPIGTTTVNCSATDSAENTATGNFDVTVADTTAPVIALNGSDPMTIQIHNSYEEPGATVTDNYDTGLKATITGTVDTNTVGTYTVYYDAVDSNNNNATQITRTVNVVDQEAPSTTDNVPAAWQNADVTITLNCTDNVACLKVYYTTDGSSPSTDSSFVDASTSWQFTVSTDGQYTIKYFGIDDSNNRESTKTATNTLKLDKTNPALTINSPSNNEYTRDNTISSLNFTASDNLSDVLDYAIYVDDVNMSGNPTTTGSVNSGSATGLSLPVQSDGSHTITIKATDKAGNYSSETMTVNVDTQNPTINSIEAVLPTVVKVTFSEDLQNNPEGHHPSSLDFKVYNGDEYTGENVYTTSEVSYENKVVTITLSDAIKSGDNPHLYVTPELTTIIDLAGNYFNNGNAYSAAVVDKIQPTITLTGSNPINLKVGDTYTEPGATATDVVDSEINVSISGTVDTNTAGTYTLTYTATDLAGNTTSTTRTVNVTPSEQINGLNNPIVYYTISSSSDSNGIVNPSGQVIIAANSSKDFVFAPNTGYQVADVLVDGVSKGALKNYTFNDVTSDHSISVTFSQIPEQKPEENKNTSGSGKLGDINNDGITDETDFAMLMSQWGQTGTGLTADLNGDGVVDELDFAILMSNWS